MATTQTVKLHIPGIGHVFYNDVDAEEFSLDQFKFGDETTYGDWTWLGDTSSENTIELEVDGGEPESRRTWDRQGVRTVYSTETVSGTIYALNMDKEVFEIAYPGGTYDAAKKKYTVPSGGGSTSKALLIVTEDGTDIAGWRFMNTSLKGGLFSVDVENFLELPLGFTIQSSLAVPTARFDWFEPRAYTPAP